MNITITNIPDVTSENINQTKQLMADNIITNVYPLFDEIYQAKKSRIKELHQTIYKRKTSLKIQKRTIEELMVQYKRAKKTSNVLDRVEKLIQLGVAYDGATKHETVILLKIIDKLSEEKLDQQLSKTIEMINKRFSQ